jgi:hypothetical protein
LAGAVRLRVADAGKQGQRAEDGCYANNMTDHGATSPSFEIDTCFRLKVYLGGEENVKAARAAM